MATVLKKFSENNKPVGVIGAGRFGIAIANILAENRDVILFSRRQEVVDSILSTREHKGQKIHERIKPVIRENEITDFCTLIFPIIPSANFREMIRLFSPHLTPAHILIHGTKGLDIKLSGGKTFTRKDAFISEEIVLTKETVRTMTEVIAEETSVVRTGCISGPNLVGEIAAHQPTATVVASRFDEVIREGQKALRSSRFKVFGTHDVLGVELAGVLKNVMAIASGILSGLGYGENARAMLITRGLAEMTFIATQLGAQKSAFFGLSGIGDMIATCSSKMSRNFSVGFRLAQGEKLDTILNSMNEVAEGLNTLKVAKGLVDYYKIRAPISQTLFKIIYKDMTVEEGMKYLMEFPFNVDVDFI